MEISIFAPQCVVPSPHFLEKCDDLLSSLSQVVTLPFQSHVCLSMSNANPLGQVICFRPDLVHLYVKSEYLNYNIETKK